MKRIFLILLITGLCISYLNAQDRKHEISVGYGAASTSSILNVFSQVVVSAITGNAYTSDANFSGAFHAGYKYFLTEHITVGGIYA